MSGGVFVAFLDCPSEVAEYSALLESHEKLESYVYTQYSCRPSYYAGRLLPFKAGAQSSEGVL